MTAPQCRDLGETERGRTPASFAGGVASRDALRHLPGELQINATDESGRHLQIKCRLLESKDNAREERHVDIHAGKPALLQVTMRATPR